MHTSCPDPVQPREPPARPGVRDPQGDAGRRPISLGLRDQLALGNVDAKRDWGFAGDCVKAMWLMQQGQGDDYVVATGETRSIRELLDVPFKHVGIEDWDKHVYQDRAFFRRADVDQLMRAAAKAKAAMGWEPEVRFEELVQ